MFDFRLINTPDGNQVIDTSLKTPCESLTVEQLQEYIKVDKQLSITESLEKKRKREMECQQKKIIKKIGMFLKNSIMFIKRRIYI